MLPQHNRHEQRTTRSTQVIQIIPNFETQISQKPHATQTYCGSWYSGADGLEKRINYTNILVPPMTANDFISLAARDPKSID